MGYSDPYQDTKIEINITTNDEWTVSINGRPIYFSHFAIDLDSKKAGSPTILLEVDPRLWATDMKL